MADTPAQFCHCGPFEDAQKTGEKLFTDMIASDCPVWAFQVGATIRTLAIDYLKREGMTVSEAKQLGDAITVATRSNCDLEALIKQGRTKKAELNGA